MARLWFNCPIECKQDGRETPRQRRFEMEALEAAAAAVHPAVGKVGRGAGRGVGAGVRTGAVALAVQPGASGVFAAGPARHGGSRPAGAFVPANR